MFEEELGYTPTADDLKRQVTAQEEKHNKTLNGLKDGSLVFYRKKYTENNDVIVIAGAESASNPTSYHRTAKIVAPQEVIDTKLNDNKTKVAEDASKFAQEILGQ